MYSETLDESKAHALQAVPYGSGIISIFFYVRLPEVWTHIVSYTSYRFECGLRSSAVLGFVGLPTLGFYLETAFNEGNYSEASALLITFYILIATIRYWLRPKLIGFYLILAPFLLGGGADIKLGNVMRFLTFDIVPAPLRGSSLFDATAYLSPELINDKKDDCGEKDLGCFCTNTRRKLFAKGFPWRTAKIPAFGRG